MNGRKETKAAGDAMVAALSDVQDADGYLGPHPRAQRLHLRADTAKDKAEAASACAAAARAYASGCGKRIRLV